MERFLLLTSFLLMKISAQVCHLDSFLLIRFLIRPQFVRIFNVHRSAIHYCFIERGEELSERLAQSLYCLFKDLLDFFKLVSIPNIVPNFSKTCLGCSELFYDS